MWLYFPECVSLISNLIVLFGGFMFFSELLQKDDAHSAAVGVQVLLVSSLVVLGIFIIVDTLPSLRWVMREMLNEAGRMKGDRHVIHQLGNACIPLPCHN